MRGLDDHITGHYGEDQFPEVEPPEFTDAELVQIYESLGQLTQRLQDAGSRIAARNVGKVSSKMYKYLQSIGEID